MGLRCHLELKVEINVMPRSIFYSMSCRCLSVKEGKS